MKRGSRRAGRRKTRTTERGALYILLISIAVLLVLILGVFPRLDPSVAEREEPVPPPEVPSPAETPRAITDEAVEPPPPTGYRPVQPAEEAPVAAAPVEEAPRPVAGTAALPDREPVPWWLPEERDPARRGPLSLVLDDAGYSLADLQLFLGLGVPFAVSVLPALDYSVESAVMAMAAGKEVMLHQPMEAVGGENPGPGAITISQSDEEIRRTLLANLASVPGAVGVNNHMGSLATQDARIMMRVMEVLDERSLFFVDSRTSHRSVARDVAAEVGLPFAERRVFLDNERTRDAILAALSGALDLAQDGQAVVMIGHVTVPLLAEVLAEALPVLAREGYRFVAVSELVAPARIAGSEDHERTRR